MTDYRSRVWANNAGRWSWVVECPGGAGAWTSVAHGWARFRWLAHWQAGKRLRHIGRAD